MNRADLGFDQILIETNEVCVAFGDTYCLETYKTEVVNLEFFNLIALLMPFIAVWWLIGIFKKKK